MLLCVTCPYITSSLIRYIIIYSTGIYSCIWSSYIVYSMLNPLHSTVAYIIIYCAGKAGSDGKAGNTGRVGNAGQVR